jgi:hypothetical protein
MVSWYFKVQKNRIKEKRWGGGNTRVLFQFGTTTGFPVDFHHPLEHLCRFGIFGKSDVLQV